jgi:hypothetical protein
MTWLAESPHPGLAQTGSLHGAELARPNRRCLLRLQREGTEGEGVRGRVKQATRRKVELNKNNAVDDGGWYTHALWSVQVTLRRPTDLGHPRTNRKHKDSNRSAAWLGAGHAVSVTAASKRALGAFTTRRPRVARGTLQGRCMHCLQQCVQGA